MKFKHFLLTRFNIGIYDRRQRMRNGEMIDVASWMVNRCLLFEKYCMPSVHAQTCKNFTWVIVCDPATPEVWLNTIQNMAKTDVIVGDNFRKASIKYIEKLLKDEDRVITTRLDNDDMLHRDCIKMIQGWVVRKERTGVVTLPKGWVWDINKDKLWHVRERGNHFLTYVEKRGKKPVKTVLRHRHTALTDKFETFNVETPFHAWVEVVHGENISNRGRGAKSDISQLKREEYGL